MPPPYHNNEHGDIPVQTFDIWVNRFRSTNFAIMSDIMCGGRFFSGLERPYFNNERNISSIPAGVYKAHIRDYQSSDKRIIEFNDVPNRSAIQFHAGNVVDDSKGCILVGETADFGGMTIGNSRAAMKLFMLPFDHAGVNTIITVTVRDIQWRASHAAL